MPAEFVFKDPSKLSSDEARKLLSLWYSRQSRGAVAFRFGSYYNQNVNRAVKAVEDGYHAPIGATKRSKIAITQKRDDPTKPSGSPQAPFVDTPANNITNDITSNGPSVPDEMAGRSTMDGPNHVEEDSQLGEGVSNGGDGGNGDTDGELVEGSRSSNATIRNRTNRPALTEVETRAVELNKSGVILDRGQKAALTRAQKKLGRKVGLLADATSDDDNNRPAVMKTKAQKIAGGNAERNVPPRPSTQNTRSTQGISQAKRKSGHINEEESSSEVEENEYESSGGRTRFQSPIDRERPALPRLPPTTPETYKDQPAASANTAHRQATVQAASEIEISQNGGSTAPEDASSDEEFHQTGKSARKYSHIPGTKRVVLDLPFGAKRKAPPPTGLNTRSRGVRQQVVPDSVLSKPRKKQKLTQSAPDELPALPAKRVSQKSTVKAKR